MNQYVIRSTFFLIDQWVMGDYPIHIDGAVLNVLNNDPQRVYLLIEASEDGENYDIDWGVYDIVGKGTRVIRFPDAQVLRATTGLVLDDRPKFVRFRIVDGPDAEYSEPVRTEHGLFCTLTQFDPRNEILHKVK
jgi:hypothetical protein